MPSLSLTGAVWGSFSASGVWTDRSDTKTMYMSASAGSSGYVGFTGLNTLPVGAQVTSALVSLNEPDDSFIARVVLGPASANPPTNYNTQAPIAGNPLTGVTPFQLASQVQTSRASGSWTSSSVLGILFTRLQSQGSVSASITLEYETGDAGPDQTVDPFTTVTLTGTPAGPSWSQVSGEPVTLGGSGAVRTFKAPAKMTQHQMVFQYGPDTMTVTVRPAKHAILAAGGAAVTPARFIRL